MADVTSFRLDLLDYQVTVVATPTEVWQAIDRAVPHAVLLNLDSEELDGFGLLDQFASDVKTSRIPILAFSSDADLDRVERAWKAGIRDYLLTPYDPQALEQKLARMLEGVEIDPVSGVIAGSETDSNPEVVSETEALTDQPENESKVSSTDERVLAAIDQAISADLTAARKAMASELNLQN